MNPLKWNNETMNIGIKLIDDQHKELLKIINRLTTSIHDNSQKKDILKVVNELINYADFHFKTEEDLFDKFNYHEEEIHKRDHSLFVEKFINIRDDISTNESFKNRTAIEIADDIFNYIIDWFLNHIKGRDKKYAELLKSSL